MFNKKISPIIWILGALIVFIPFQELHQLPDIKKIFDTDDLQNNVGNIFENISAIFIEKAHDNKEIYQSEDNLINNGSFEIPDIGERHFQVFYSGSYLGNWYVASGSVDIVHNWPAATGKQSLDLEGYGRGIILQNIDTVSGQYYSLSFALGGNFEGPPVVKTMELWWNGALLATLSFDTTNSGYSDMGYVYYSYEVVATQDITELKFKATTPGWSYGAVIDDVSINASSHCEIPFFSQRDSEWIKYPLRGSCPASCFDPNLGYVTIGTCGCALTSAAMVFNAYGVTTNPQQLSYCLDDKACPIYWSLAASDCSQHKVNWVDIYEYEIGNFSWKWLENELNSNHHPAILGMCKKGTCGAANEQTHWVVVLSGQGDDPKNYYINDPWEKCGVNIPLAIYSTNWEFISLRIYKGVTPCSSIVVDKPQCVDRGAHPEPVVFSNINNNYSPELLDITNSVISGTVWAYTRNEITMTLEVTASSKLGELTDMVMWSDSITNTNWQPFTPFVWMPASDFVYVQFRDDLGNVSDVYSDTINPFGPPEAPYFELFLPFLRK